MGTHTFAELEVSDSTYDEIRKALEEAGYDHAFVDGAIDMHGIGLVRRVTSVDRRFVYGAMCTWWESIEKVATLPSGLPVCPGCKRPLMEVEDESKLAIPDEFEADNPGYRAFFAWVRGKCFPDHRTARLTYDAEASKP